LSQDANANRREDAALDPDYEEGPMTKCSKFLAGCAIGSLLAAAPPAPAAVYSFSFTDPIFTVAGQFTTANVLNALGGHDVLSIAGTVAGPNGATISGLIANPNQPNNASYSVPGFNWTFNNVFYAASPNVDFGGILFEAGAYTYNIYFNGRHRLSTNNPGGFFAEPPRGVFTVAAAVPEPSTWAMMLIGFAGLAFVSRRRRMLAAA
jgi:hypothetical protein